MDVAFASPRWYDHHTTNSYRIRDRRRGPRPEGRGGLRAGPLPAATRSFPSVFSLEVFESRAEARRPRAARIAARSEEVSGTT